MTDSRLGIWGPRGSGKTTYLTLLPYSNSKLRFTPANKETGKFLTASFEALTSRGVLPEKTIVESEPFLSIRVEVPPTFLGGSAQILLEVPNLAGEIYENPDEFSHVFDTVDYFKNCVGILWFIDPNAKLTSFGSRFTYQKMLVETLLSLYTEMENEGNLRKGRLPHFMAFCLAKMDSPEQYEAFRRSDTVEYLEKILGTYWFRDVVHFCDPARCRVFAFSALGMVRTEEGNYISNLDGRNIIDPEHIHPFGIEQPIEWIVEMAFGGPIGAKFSGSQLVGEETARQATKQARSVQQRIEYLSKLRVFLCHASEDKTTVRGLYQRLRADGIQAWLDAEELVAGQDWQYEIPKAVRTSDIVIVCLSKKSVNKAGFVQKEIKYALDAADEQPEGTIFIIPLRLEECEVPERLRRWQWINWFEGDGYERLRRALKIRADSKVQ